MQSDYLQLGPLVRITQELEIEVWRKFLWGDKRLTCKCDRRAVQINTYYNKFMRTTRCGNFGMREIGLNAIKTSELLRIARLDTNVSEIVQRDGTNIGRCYFGGINIGMSLDGSRLVYPYSSLDFDKENGELRTYGYGHLIAEFNEEESIRVKGELDFEHGKNGGGG